jgi:hypothetical protein
MSHVPGGGDVQRREERATREANRVGCILIVAFLLFMGFLAWMMLR